MPGIENRRRGGKAKAKVFVSGFLGFSMGFVGFSNDFVVFSRVFYVFFNGFLLRLV